MDNLEFLHISLEIVNIFSRFLEDVFGTFIFKQNIALIFFMPRIFLEKLLFIFVYGCERDNL